MEFPSKDSIFTVNSSNNNVNAPTDFLYYFFANPIASALVLSFNPFSLNIRLIVCGAMLVSL